jgi:peroxiredoxin
VIAIALVLGGIALVWGVLDSRSDQPYAAPDFTLTTYSGAKYRLSDLRGKVVVINFWASWCVPCRVEAPALQQLWTDLQNQNVMILGIDQADKTEDALVHIHQYNLTYPNGPDDGIADRYGIQGLPTTIVVDPRGIVTDTILMAVEPHNLQARIEAALTHTQESP